MQVSPREVAREIEKEAARQGVPPSDFASTAVTRMEEANRSSWAEFLATMTEGVHLDVPLSDYAVSRAGIYDDPDVLPAH